MADLSLRTARAAAREYSPLLPPAIAGILPKLPRQAEGPRGVATGVVRSSPSWRDYGVALPRLFDQVSAAMCASFTMLMSRPGTLAHVALHPS